MLELSDTNSQRLIFCHPVVSPILQRARRYGEVVHEHERPAVGDSSFYPEDGPLESELTGGFSALIAVCITALHVTVNGDAVLQLLQPVNLLGGFLLLRHDTRADEGQQQGERRLSEKIFESHFSCFLK